MRAVQELRHDRTHSRKVQCNCGKDDRHLRRVRTSSFSGSGKYEEGNVEEERQTKHNPLHRWRTRRADAHKAHTVVQLVIQVSFGRQALDEQPELSCMVTEGDLKVSENGVFTLVTALPSCYNAGRRHHAESVWRHNTKNHAFCRCAAVHRAARQSQDHRHRCLAFGRIVSHLSASAS